MAWSTRRFAVRTLAWGGCLIGALSIATWPGNWGHGICGPWGCGPPLQALIACHLSWFVVLTPIALWVVRSTRISDQMQRNIGLLAAGAALAGIAAVLAHQYFVWWPQAGEFQRPYFWQRFGFTIATMVDVPMVQALLIGLGIELSGRTHRRTEGSLASGDSTVGAPAATVLPDDGRPKSPVAL